MTVAVRASACRSGEAVAIGRLASRALLLELDTWPKPGLVSRLDNGAHDDMDARLLAASARTLEPFFIELAAAGGEGAPMDRLRAIGVAAEQAMRVATGGVNTHRGAIFGLGLLAAAAGFRERRGSKHRLGALVAHLWGPAIEAGPVEPRSHGGIVASRYGVGGARAEAAAGMPSLHHVALPALRRGRGLAGGEEEAARVHACLTLIAVVEDTNLLFRGGPAGLAFARREARSFLAAGGVGAPGWRACAEAIHRRFVARRLSPGGSADLLAMALFADTLSQ